MRLNGPRKEPESDAGNRSGAGSGARQSGKGGARGNLPATIPAATLRPSATALARIGTAGRRARHDDAASDAERAWSRLRLAAIEPRFHERARTRLISCRPDDPASLTFDILRTRLLRALQDRGWSRIAVTSPTAGCGKTFSAANLAISMSRLSNVRTLLLDLDLRLPGLARAFDVGNVGAIETFLAEPGGSHEHLFRIGANLALCLNDRPVAEAAALLQHPTTRSVLDDLQDTLRPDVTIHDMPPMLGSDDVEAFLPQVDGVLLVVDATRTTAKQIADCERMLDGQTPLLGIVLNRAEEPGSRYGYPAD